MLGMENYQKQAEVLVEERLNELLQIAKEENETFDDHGPVILGDRLQKPHFTEEAPSE